MKTNLKTLVFVSCMLTLIGIGNAAAIIPATVDTESAIGHTFDEEYWAIEYDVLSLDRTQDYLPGEFNQSYTGRAVDPFPNMDANYYTVYVNVGRVQTLYMALTNFSWNNTNPNSWGVSPYQVLAQHFRGPGGNHVFVENTFAGLIAFQENETEANGVPDQADEVFHGYLLNSQYHKHLIRAEITEALGDNPFDDDVVASVTPKIITKTEENGKFTFEWGISYENLVVMWREIDTTDSLDENITSTDVLLSRIVAISKLDYFNFTYTLTGKSFEDQTNNITTSTEYDIGPMSELWIRNETMDMANEFGGHYFSILGGEDSLVRYNETSTVQARLAGNETIPSFGLAVANYAKVHVLTATTTAHEIVDQANSTIDGSTTERNVTRLNLRAAANRVYDIDFASKPNYTLGGSTEELPAPVKVYPNLHVNPGEIGRLALLANRFITRHLAAEIQSRVDANANITGIVDINQDVFYTISFPEWGGQSIYQDPTFTAYAEPIIGTDGRRIDGYGLGAVVLIGAVSSLVLVKKHQKHQEL